MTVDTRPELICSENEDWFGVAGHVPPADLFRAIHSHTGERPLDIMGAWTFTQAKAALRRVRHGWWRCEEEEDPTTWVAAAQNIADYGGEGWPWPDAEAVFFVCDESDPGAEPCTWWEVS